MKATRRLGLTSRSLQWLSNSIGCDHGRSSSQRPHPLLSPEGMQQRRYATENSQMTDGSGENGWQAFQRGRPVSGPADGEQAIGTSAWTRLKESEEPPSAATGMSKGELVSSGEDEKGRVNVHGTMSKALRVVPVSGSYWSESPSFCDQLVRLSDLAHRHQSLPRNAASASGSAPVWATRAGLRSRFGEPIPFQQWQAAMEMVKRLGGIESSVMPEEVNQVLIPFRRRQFQLEVRVKERKPDTLGRALGAGRRKTSVARAWVVDGTGEVLVNGKPIRDTLSRIHDRESALWPLAITGRADKYNVWALVEGGGTTGQAEALTLAIARALVVHEPALKTALRSGGCITRDPRMVERKVQGRLKSRKKPAWVKR